MDVSKFKQEKDILNKETFIEIFDIKSNFDRECMLNEIRDLFKSNKKNGWSLTKFENFLKAFEKDIKNNDDKNDESTEQKYRIKYKGKEYVFNMGSYTIKKDYQIYTSDNKKLVNCLIFPISIMTSIENGTKSIELIYKQKGETRWNSIIVGFAVVCQSKEITHLSSKIPQITSNNNSKIIDYIQEMIDENKDIIANKKSVAHCGWMKYVDENDEEKTIFVPYDDEIVFVPLEENTKDVDNDTRAKIYNSIGTSGSYDEWLQKMYELRNTPRKFDGHKILRFMQAVSFASPLLEILDALGFVVILWGTSGTSKSVAVAIATSIWGDPNPGHLQFSCNNTAIYLYRLSAFIKNLPSFLDELQTFPDKDDPKKVAALVYGLGNGTSRGTGKKEGGINDVENWHNISMITGEQKLLSSVSFGGAMNRTIEVNYEGCKGDRIVDNGKQVMRFFHKNYGHGGKKYIDYIRNEVGIEKLIERYDAIQAEIAQKTNSTEKQSLCMAVILLADQLSCECIFKEDKPLEISDVEKFMFSEQDIDVGNVALKLLLNMYDSNKNKFKIETEDKVNLGKTIFIMDENIKYSNEIWGKVDKDLKYIVFNETVAQELLNQKGIPYESALASWKNNGLLIRASNKSFYHNFRVNGSAGTYIKFDLDSYYRMLDNEDKKQEENKIENGNDYLAPSLQKKVKNGEQLTTEDFNKMFPDIDVSVFEE